MVDKLIVVSLTFQRDDGSVYIRSIADEDAVRWNEMNTSVATIAYVHGCNPDWQSIKWGERELLLPTEVKP